MNKDYINKLYQQGRNHEINKGIQARKAKGVFYTPEEIVDYMVQNALSQIDVRKDPYIRILDISCGSGYFLLKCFAALKQIFEEHYEEILRLHPELQQLMPFDDIGGFIAAHNIWGVDIDQSAVTLAQETLQHAAGSSCTTHIICADSLLSGMETEEHKEFWGDGFDCIIGNPPYIGHKKVEAQYKVLLYKHYGQVYRDKSDISYCFFYRAMEQLREGGLLSFITSRYFMEGPSAEGLRDYLSGYDIQEIIEFGDRKVFADAGVAVSIINILKQGPSPSLKIKTLEKRLERWHESAFFIDKHLLKKDGWLLLEPQKLEVFQRLEAQGTHLLEDIFESYQGIITGCDKAFVLEQKKAEALKIEPELLRPWIKNSNVDKFSIKTADKLLIYADLISEEALYPNAVSFIGTYKEKLMQRRECQKGIRRWHQLQWGRKQEVFEQEKLVYPYKAAFNRFAVDRRGHYCSADVYSLALKKEYEGKLSLDYIAALLNSTLMTFYFKAIAKKIGPSLYDYYPNKVLKIKLKLDVLNGKIEELVKELYNTSDEVQRRCILEAIDRELYSIYGLKDEQINLIKKSAEE